MTKIMIQARTGSIRFPNKVLEEIDGKPMVQYIYDKFREGDAIVLIPDTDELLRLELCKREIKFYCGDEHDLISRYYKAAKHYKADTIVRITADCPLVYADEVYSMLNIFNVFKLDYLTNKSYIDGKDIEICSFKCLRWLDSITKSIYHREHVFSFINEYGLPAGFKSCPKLSVDTKEDLERIKAYLDYFKGTQY